MTDIVERLRQFDPETFGRVHAWEAADELERLRAALQQIVERYETAEDGWPAEDMRTIARAALEPKP